LTFIFNCAKIIKIIKTTHPQEVKLQKLKVLFLDREENGKFLPGVEQLLPLEVNLELFSEIDQPHSTEFFEKIRKLTAKKMIDLVVIGNNLGAGVKKAEAVAKKMRDRTIILWNRYTPGCPEEKHYRELGITRFASRSDLPKEILEMIKEDV